MGLGCNPPYLHYFLWEICVRLTRFHLTLHTVTFRAKAHKLHVTAANTGKARSFARI
jgi:hypothetical protein